jgi:uncharacterized protein
MGDKLPITRERAMELLKSFSQAESDWNHYLESEAIMRALAEKFGENKDYWGMVGLLHDVDWGITKDSWEEHCVKAEEILKTEGFDEEFIENVQSHAYGYDKIPTFKDRQRSKKIHYALVASETLTGIIYAYALMRGKNISTMEVSGLKKKFKDKAFAQNCNRDLVREIEKTELTLDEFFAISIEATKNIRGEIGIA